MNSRIKTGLNSGRPFIKLRYRDSIYRFLKDSLFGFKTQEGVCYRFYKGLAYMLLNPGEQIPLYRTDRNTGTTKYPRTEISYFFSKTTESPIKELALNTLFADFASDTSFIHLVEIYFRSDKELPAFDAYHKKYKLNRLLELSTQQKNN